MELLQLIIFSLCYSFMSASTFFDTVLICLFLKITYKTNLLQANQYDPTSVLLNLVNIMLHLMVYQMGVMIEITKQNNIGNKVICTYNQLNTKYVQLRNKLLHWVLFTPMKFVMKKAIGNLVDETAMEEIKKLSQMQAQKMASGSGSNEHLQGFGLGFNNIPKLPKTTISPNIKLNSNQDINNFLDGLLESKKTN